MQRMDLPSGRPGAVTEIAPAPPSPPKRRHTEACKLRPAAHSGTVCYPQTLHFIKQITIYKNPKSRFMRFRNWLLLAALALAGATQAQMQMPPIPLDPAVKIGKLDNGLTYYIRYNNWPEKRANFYIAQKVGSIQEEEAQRGLAHFLEHMCFNGTKHFPGDALLRYCESLGVKFGADLNAYTSIDRTVYNIDNVPTARQSALDSCLLILRDWAGSLTLDPKEIDQERGVIHEEWRLRTSPGSRMFERNLPKLYPGSKYGLRYPIGLMSVVDNFKYKELRDYYEKWYHPSNQGIIVVGDVDVNHVEAEIKRLFGDLKNPLNAAPVVEEQVPNNNTPIVIVDKDKELNASMVEVMMKHDAMPDSMKTDLSYLLYNYVKGVGIGLLNDRLAEAALKSNCPFVSANASDASYIFAKTKDAFTIGVSPKDMSQTAEALKAAYAEALRAAEFGFTPSEYERSKASTLGSLDKMYSNKDKRFTQQFASECTEHFLANEPMPPIDFYYETMKKMVPSIPLDYINETFKELVAKTDTNLVIISFNPEKEGSVYPTEESLLGAVKQARSQKLEAYVDNVKNEPLLATLPKPGKIKGEKRNEKFGYTEITLSNGVTVLLKKTDFKKDQVSLSGKGGGGSSLYGEKDYTNLQLFDDVVENSGLGVFSKTELSKALAGKIASANLSISDRRMQVSGSSTPKDLETMLQLVYLHFTQIKKDPEAFNNLMAYLQMALKNRETSPDVAYQDSVQATLYGHNKRLKPLELTDLPKISCDRILQMAAERTANANGWCFTFVGNYDEKTIRPLICRYLGSLPSKGKNVEGRRTKFFQRGIVKNDFTRKMETPKANATMVWFNESIPYSVENSIKANMVGEVLKMVYLKKIREEASAAYSCGASGWATIDDDYHFAAVYAVCPMKPEKSAEALQIMRDEMPQLAKSCDASMLAKVKEYMLKEADDQAKSNDYWMGVINTWHRYGIDSYTQYKALVTAQTPESISHFAKEILKAGNHIEVTMMPAEEKK